MNPPFGTKLNENVLNSFIEYALAISRGPIYVLHKETFNGLEKLIKKFDE